MQRVRAAARVVLESAISAGAALLLLDQRRARELDRELEAARRREQVLTWQIQGLRADIAAARGIICLCELGEGELGEVIEPIQDAEGHTVLDPGDVVQVERPAARGQVKVAGRGGESLCFALASGKVRRLPREST